MKKYNVTVHVWATVEMEVEAETKEEAEQIGQDYWSDENVEYEVDEIDVHEIK